MAKGVNRSIHISINNKEVKNNIHDIKKEFFKLNTEISNAEIGSTEYNKKAAEIKKLKGIMTEHRKSLGGVSSMWDKVKTNIAGIASATVVLATVTKAVQFLTNSTREYNEISSAAAKTTGLQGKELDKVTKKVINLSKAYKEDYNKVLTSANTFSKEMGISQAKALDLIETGYQKGANASGEFMDILREYPTFFKSAGLSADESIALISQQVSEGIYSDKGIDAIKEGTLRLREMTPATREAIENIGISSKELEKQLKSGTISYFDAIQMVSDKLGEFPEQSTEVGTALADIFGGAGEDAGIRYIKMLGEMDLNIENVKDKASELEKAKISLGNAFRDNLNPVLNKASGLMAKFLSSVTDYVTVPMSIKLQEEQMDLNTLVTRITDVNIAQTDRNKLITKLQGDYPGFLKNLDAEKVTNEQLTKLLKDVNAEYINRIIIQTQKEKIEEKAKKVGDYTNEKLEKEYTVTQKLNELNVKYKLGLDLTNKTYGERYKLVEDALMQEAKYFESYDEYGTKITQARNDEGKALLKLSNEKAAVGRANRNLILAQRELNEVTLRGNEILKEAGLELSSDSGSPISGSGSSSTNNSSTNNSSTIDAGLKKKQLAAIEAEKQLAAKIKEIREQLHISTLSDQEKEIAVIELKYEKILADAKKGSKEEIELNELKDKEIASINKKYADKAAKSKEEAIKKIEGILLSSEEKEIETVKEKYLKLIELAEQNGLGTAALFEKLNEELDKLQEGEATDIFGMTQTDWDKLEDNFNKAMAFAGQLSSLWGSINQIRANQEEEYLMQFEANTDRRKEQLQSQLDAGIISQEAYNNQVAKLDEKLDTERRKIQHEQAKREKNLRLFEAGMNTAASVISMLANPGGIAGVALSVMAGIVGAAQIAAIATEPLPALADGARVRKPTVALIGEAGEEFVLSNKTITDPELAPMAEYLMQNQEGLNPTYPDNASISNAINQGYGSSSSTVSHNTYSTNNYNTSSSGSNDALLNEIRQMNQFLSDPANRKAYISNDIQKRNDEELNILNQLGTL
jgi:hypothetical protein